MRITDTSIVNDFLASINRSKERINRLNLQLATQSRVLKVSDDPDAASTILRLNADLDRVSTFRNNVTTGKNALTMTGDSLGRVADLLSDVKGVMTGASGSGDRFLLTKLADQMDQYLSLGLEIANTQFDRKYIFGGTHTTAPPFVQGGTPPQTVYRGNAQSIQYQVGDGVSHVVNITGAAAFGSTGQLSLSGLIDNSAAVNSSVYSTVQVTDAAGVVHDIAITMRKTDAHTWAMSAALPPGATGATLTGGTTSISFDPVSGAVAEVVRGTPLVLTPTATAPGQAAPPLSIMVRTEGLTEGSTGGASSLAGAYQNVSLFNKLAQLRDQLRSGQPPSSEDMAMIDLMQDVVSREEARAGSLMTSLTNADNYLISQREHLLDLRSAKQDVDLYEVGMKLKQEQLMLDAALSTAARLIPRSLMDFLK